jgi:hypothetical protein
MSRTLPLPIRDCRIANLISLFVLARGPVLPFGLLLELWIEDCPHSPSLFSFLLGRLGCLALDGRANGIEHGRRSLLLLLNLLGALCRPDLSAIGLRLQNGEQALFLFGQLLRGLQRVQSRSEPYRIKDGALTPLLLKSYDRRV